MTYIPGTGPQPVFPAAHLSLCPQVCPLQHLETTITLHTDHTGQGCDRYQILLCKAEALHTFITVQKRVIEILTPAHNMLTNFSA